MRGGHSPFPPAPSPRPVRRHAFTLIEVMLVIALIGMATLLLLSGLEPMLHDARKTSPYETLCKAIDAAWYGAANNHEQYVLEYDAGSKTILVYPLRKQATGTATPRDENATPPGESLKNDSINPDGANASGTDSEIQQFAFAPGRVDSLEFLRPPDVGRGTLQHTSDFPYPCLYFSPWGGVTPASVILTSEGRTFRYSIEPFGGALEKHD